jgi:hypothetical protein
VQGKILVVASTERGRFGEHINIGYTAAHGDVGGALAGLTSAPLPDEINYSGGVEFVASPRLTVIGDLVGRTLRGAGRLDLASQPFEYNSFRRRPVLGAPKSQETSALRFLSRSSIPDRATSRCCSAPVESSSIPRGACSSRAACCSP